MASDTITMLCLAAMGKSNKLNHSAQRLRVELVHGLLQESIRHAEEQMAQLKTMEERIVCQAKTSDKILSTVKSGMNSLSQVHSIVIDMKSVLSLLCNHILSQQAAPHGLGTHWQQAPVTLEDALGFMVPIPLELVNTWEMFDIILSKRFEKHPGHEMIQRREYAIEDSSSGHELGRESELLLCVRPGQKIEMTVVFSEKNSAGNSCPRCQTEVIGWTDVRIQCRNLSCKMWFHRIEEVLVEEQKKIGPYEPYDLPEPLTPKSKSPQARDGPRANKTESESLENMNESLDDNEVGDSSNPADNFAAAGHLVDTYISELRDLYRLKKHLYGLQNKISARKSEKLKRKHSGFTFAAIDQEWLDDEDAEYREMVSEVFTVEKEIEELTQSCLSKHLIDEDGEPTNFDPLDEPFFEV
ncbi:hypothetical protein EG329_004168 [Mollisiaceae sp. DMI_Dod_QoI]|nr:hypothetical protein EG329_004168 [Helotiales sp. DMI_Dod_QoI]